MIIRAAIAVCIVFAAMHPARAQEQAVVNALNFQLVNIECASMLTVMNRFGESASMSNAAYEALSKQFEALHRDYIAGEYSEAFRQQLQTIAHISRNRSPQFSLGRFWHNSELAIFRSLNVGADSSTSEVAQRKFIGLKCEERLEQIK
ncbi:MAG: hypothetical protein AAF764_10500 [Pseudomonadota bacterium]